MGNFKKTLKKKSKDKGKITFGDITNMEWKQNDTILKVWIGDKKYLISKTRLDKSSCDDDVELYRSTSAESNGKWLIPADATTQVNAEKLLED